MQYKLLALDIDGTLLNSRGELTDRTVAAVKTAAASGLKVCLVSGRRGRSMAPFAQVLGLTDPMVCYNGGSVTLPDTFQNLHSACLPRDAILPIIQAWEGAGLPVLAFRDSSQPPDVYLSGDSQWPPLCRYVEQETASGNLQRVDSLVTGAEWPLLRVYTQGDDATAQLVSRLADPLIDPAALRVIFTQHYDGSWFYEIYPVAATKSSGLRWLGQHFGISQSEMVAVGDHVNDLDMIEYAGLGVAMGNAQPEVKQLADRVIGHHDQDGLAVFIEQLLTER